MQSRMTDAATIPAAETPTAPARTTTDAWTVRIDAGGRGIRLMRRLIVTNLVLVAVQALSAGFLLSGYAGALTVHVAAALALQLGALVQAVTAIVLWQRRRVPVSVAGFSIGLVVAVFLQVGLGYTKQYWLHVPIGVGMFGWLMQQVNRVDALWRTI